MKSAHRILGACLLWLIGSSAARAASPAVVQVSVADVRQIPAPPEAGKSDRWQETQVLFGEPVTVTGSSGTWLSIEAPEQMEFTHHNRWEGYPGWVEASALSTSTVPSAPTHVVSQKWISVYDTLNGTTTLRRLPLGALLSQQKEQEGWISINLYNGSSGWVRKEDVRDLSDILSTAQKRTRILKTAQRLAGDAYVWGGLSPVDMSSQTLLSGVDCSGLVHLSYRVNGVLVPRDSHEQYLRAEKISRAQLRPADLIFSAPAQLPQKITHVALFMGDDWLIEAPQTGMTVRRIRAQDKFGRPLAKIESGTVVGDRVVYFGRFLSR